jgi:sugar lactone lactonase YvrE
MSLCTLIMTCALLGGPAPADPDTAHPAWPPLPDRPRIRHIQTISSSADFRVSEGVFESLLGLLFGGDESRPWLVQPVGIAVSPTGVLAIADPGAHAVHLIDLGAGEYRILTESPSGLLRSPVGVAFDRRGFLFVSDPELHGIVVFDEDGDVERLLTSGFERPTGVLCVGDALYVVDTGAHTIVRVDQGGNVVQTIGGRGTEGGSFNFPVQLTGTDTLFVVDALNYRVQALLPSGAFVSTFGGMGTGLGTFAGPKAVARDSEGHLYVTDALLDNVQIFDTSGRLLLVVGKQGSGNGEFMSPGGIAIDRNDRIYVVDALNRRLQVFQYQP